MVQLGLYIVVGGLVTAVDLLVYNLLSGQSFRLSRVSAHLVSTACAMLAGFTLHLMLVFRPPEHLLLDRMCRYVLTVCCSAYVLQTFIIFLLSSLWTAPTQLAGALYGRFYDVAAGASDVVERNFVKACAIGSGLVFNFVSFKFFVYGN